MKNQKGFSLLEILITVGLLSIVSAIATVSYHAYIDDAKRTSVAQAINKIQHAFQMCMAFSNNKLDSCNEFSEIKYTLPQGNEQSGELTVKLPVRGTTTNKNKICFNAQIKGEGTEKGKSACAGYENGNLIKSCTQPEKTGTCDSTGACVCN